MALHQVRVTQSRRSAPSKMPWLRSRTPSLISLPISRTQWTKKQISPRPRKQARPRRKRAKQGARGNPGSTDTGRPDHGCTTNLARSSAGTRKRVGLQLRERVRARLHGELQEQDRAPRAVQPELVGRAETGRARVERGRRRDAVSDHGVADDRRESLDHADDARRDQLALDLQGDDFVSGLRPPATCGIAGAGSTEPSVGCRGRNRLVGPA